MKQKYTLTIDLKGKELSIREYAEIEKEEFAFVCEEIYAIDDFKNSMSEGAVGLVPIIRRPNMYPRQDFCEKIAQGIIDLLNDDSGETKSEIMINDKDAFESAEEDIDPRVVLEDEDDDEENDSDDTELDIDGTLDDDDKTEETD